MVSNLVSELRSKVDFSKKFVCYDGRRQSKFSVSYLIGMVKPLSPYAIYPDAYPYADYVSELKKVLGL